VRAASGSRSGRSAIRLVTPLARSSRPRTTSAEESRAAVRCRFQQPGGDRGHPTHPKPARHPTTRGNSRYHRADEGLAACRSPAVMHFDPRRVVPRPELGHGRALAVPGVLHRLGGCREHRARHRLQRAGLLVTRSGQLRVGVAGATGEAGGRRCSRIVQGSDTARCQRTEPISSPGMSTSSRSGEALA
jgi:hypothetical protein